MSRLADLAHDAPPGTPPPPQRTDPVETRATVAIGALGLGALACCALHLSSWFLDVEGYTQPKELALHATALIVGVLLWPRLVVTRTALLLLGYLSLSSASLVTATNTWLALRALALSASTAVVLLAAMALARDGHGRRLVALVALVATGVAVAVLLEAQGVPGLRSTPFRGPGGLQGVRGYAAQALAVGVPALVAIAVRSRGVRQPALWTGLFVLVAAALTLTRARTAWLALLVAAPLLVWSLRARRGRLAVVLAAGATGVLLAAYLPNQLAWRSEKPYRDSLAHLLDLGSGTGQGRVLQARTTLAMAAAHPVLGVGPGNASIAYPAYAPDEDPSVKRGQMWQAPAHASCDWLVVGAERGWGALVLLALIAGRLLWRALRHRLRAPATRTLGAVLVVVAVAGAGNALTQLALPSLLIALLLGALAPHEAPVHVPAVVRPVAALLTGAGIAAGLLFAAAQTYAGAQLGDARALERFERVAPLFRGHGRIEAYLAARLADQGDCAAAAEHARRAVRDGDRAGLVLRAQATCPAIGSTADRAGAR